MKNFFLGMGPFKKKHKLTQSIWPEMLFFLGLEISKFKTFWLKKFCSIQAGLDRFQVYKKMSKALNIPYFKDRHLKNIFSFCITKSAWLVIWKNSSEKICYCQSDQQSVDFFCHPELWLYVLCTLIFLLSSKWITSQ